MPIGKEIQQWLQPGKTFSNVMSPTNTTGMLESMRRYTCTILSLFFLYYFKLFPCCAYLYVLMSHNLAFIKTKLLIIFST